MHDYERTRTDHQEHVSNTGTTDLPAFGALDLNAMTTAAPGHSHTLSRGTYRPPF
ncbi:hypothetical protein CROQUDRAFT_100079 [Cronartium quercuum f. sp. fusiforme G11]|uniref:Uncharacterized protein n=1 Tax=Cronartium quercuum f. sp. fusiforme G11 TaxID=708437 RepID=A0A9P6N6I9_9BASI|nr:hypothetical protein CROQUDRAFT_100079 [Cronartium quercuum f. sp. fusiforme G11]